MSDVPTALVVIVLGAALLALAAGGLRWARLREPRLRATAQATVAMPAEAPLDTGVVVAERGGRVVFANARARQFYGLNGELPTLGQLVRQTEPHDPFLELFASEGQAEVSVGSRRLQASSLRLPFSAGVPEQYVVMLRDTTALETAALGPAGPNAQPVQILAEINRAIAESLDPDATCAIVLDQVGRLYSFQMAEINLWDEAAQLLRPAQHAGDADYGRKLARAGGAYQLGEGYSGWLARHRRPLVVGSATSFTEARPKLAGPDFPFESYVGVPMMAGDDFVGTLELASYAIDTYPADAAEWLGLIGAQAAVAIRNGQKYAEQQRQVSELSGVAEITRSLEAAGDPQDLLARLTAEIGRYMGVQQVAYLAHHPAARSLESQAPMHGLPDIVTEILRIELRPGSRALEVWEADQPLVSQEAATDSVWDELGLRQFVETSGTRTLMLVPVNSAGRRLGLLLAANKLAGGGFAPEDVRLLTILAGQAAAVLDNARLVREAELRAVEADGLRAIAAATAANPSLDAALHEAMEHAARLLHFDLGMVTLVDDARGELVPHPASVIGGPPAEASAIRLRTDDPLFAVSVTRTRRPFRTGSAARDRRIVGGYRQLVERFQVNSAMVAPLVAADRSIGEIIVGTQREHAFSAADSQLLMTIAAQLAAAIERARLYAATDQSLQRRVDQLTALTRVSREINQTLQLDRILRLVHEEAVYAARATCGTIVLLDAAAVPPAVALRLGDEALGQQLTPLETEVARGDVYRHRVRDLEDSSPNAPHAGVRAALVVPIIAQAQVVGLIHLHSDQPEGFDDAAEEAALTLAAQAAIAIENARRFEDQIKRGDLLRRRADQLGQLFQISRSVRSDLPLAGNLETIAFGLQEAVGYNVVIISVLEPHFQRLHRTAATGLPLAVFREIRRVRMAWEDVARLFKREYQISQSFFLPADRASALRSSLDALLVHYSPSENIGVDAWQPDDILLVPLRASGDEPVGLLTVHNPRDGRRPDRNTIEVIEIFANQAAQAIENARLYASAERRAGQLLALHRVVESASPGSESWQKAAETLLAEMRGLDVCMLGQVDAGGQLTIAGWAGSVRPHVALEPLLARDNPLSHALQERAPLSVLNVAGNDWALNPFIMALEIASFISVPILSQGTPAGAVFVGAIAHRDQASPFEPGDLDVFTILANQLGSRLESARLQADVQQRAAQMAALAAVAQTITASLRTQDVLDAVVDPSGLSTVVPYDSVTLWLREDSARAGGSDGGRLRIVAARGFDNDAERLGLHVDIADSALFAEMAQTLAPILVPEAAADPRFAAGALQPTQSWLGAPLVSQGRVLGALALDKTEPNFYAPQTAPVLMAFASQVAAALDNASLYEESEQRAHQLDDRSHRLGLLSRASAQLSGMLNEEQIFAVTLAEVATALNVGQTRAVTIESHPGAVPSAARLLRTAAQYPAGEAPAEPSAALLERVWQTLSPLAIEDVNHDSLLAGHPALRAALAKRSVRSLLLVPLVLAGQAAAALELEHTGEPRHFSPSEIELAQTLANQAAVAIQRARLYAETQARVTELATINRLSLALTTQLEPEALVRMVGAQLHDIFSAPIAYIALYDSERERIDFPYWMEPDSQSALEPLVLGQGLTSHIIRTRRALMINSDADRVTKGLGGIHSGGLSTKSYLGVPMVVGDEVIGVLSVQSAEREWAFSDSDERLLGTIAANLAVALQNARLFAQTQAALSERTRSEQARRRRNDELEALNRVTTAVTSLLDPRAILEATSREIVRIFGARNTGIALLNPARTELAVVADYSAEASEPSTTGLVIPLEGNPSSAYVVETGQSIVISQAQTNPLTAAIHDLMRERHTEGLMIVPLRVRGEVIGTIGIDTDQPDREFTPAEVSLVETIAGQISGAVENARFAQDLEARVAARTQELERERARVEALLQVTTELSSSLDLDRVLSRALELVSGSIRATQSSIFLTDLETNQIIHRAVLGRERPMPIGGEPAPFKRGEGLVGWVIQNRRGAVIGELKNDPRWKVLPGQDSPHRSALAVPLVTNEDSLGAMILYSSEPNAFDDAQLRLAAAAANQVAAAINNAELYRLIRDQAERLGGMLRYQQVEATKSRAILEGIADGVLVADAEGDVILFNVACEHILGLARDAVVGRPLSEFVGIYGAGAQDWTQAIDRWRYHPGSYRPGEFVAQRLQLDNDHVISVHLAPVMASDEYLGSVSVIRDVTREVEVDRLKSEFVTNVSHELRTPMTSIKGYADLLLLGAAGQLSGDQARFLEIIKNNADRLGLLVNDLLDISRIESGKVQLVMRPISVGDVINDVVATIEGHSKDQAKPMTLVADAPRGLPPAWGDRERVTEIIMNLAENAYTYSEAGGRITLHASHDEARRQIVVEVTDSGIGIPPGDQPRIFDRFYRGEDALVLGSAGTGLGLPIARQLAEMHGGRLWLVRSETGRGSTFALALPTTGAQTA